MMLRMLVASFCLAMLSSKGAQASKQGIAYGPDPAQLLDICTPAVPAGRAPAILLIHGGGWRNGSRAMFDNLCANVGRAGIVAIPVDYRLSSGMPGTTWPVQLNDVQLAMRWVRSHASQYGIDPAHICAEGDSAGGQLALLLGVLPAIDPGDMQSLFPGVSPKADCVVAISGPSDLLALATFKAGMVANLVGPGEVSHVMALEHSGSPALRARPGAAPSLLIHGMQDPVVDFSQAEEMAASLARVGTPAWLVTHPGGHEMKGMTDDERRVAWPHILDFVRTERLPGPPRRLTTEAWVGAGP